MEKTVSSDTLHRLVKLAVDSGQAASFQEAEQIFAGYRLGIAAGPDIAYTATGQAALLTAVNCARRSFLGGVEVSGPMEADLLVPWGTTRTLGEAVIDLQGTVVDVMTPEIPRIVVGDAGAEALGPFAVRATWEGWSGGVIPLDDDRRLIERTDLIPAGVLAGGIAVAEAFQHVRGGNVLAGRRAAGLSLWRPAQDVDWLAAPDGPCPAYLPARLWLIGLGHLGQAYLWTLGLLPYAEPGELHLVLQDIDVLTKANDSTSPLTRQALIGLPKTRAMATWADQRGFKTAVVERRFAPNFQIADDEPRVALCGVDNALARAALEDVGFARVIEAGLGKGTQEYLAFQLHTFPGTATAHQLWDQRIETGAETAALIERPAYRALAAGGLDACGLTQLAGRTVGAPFVGMVTSALVVAELIRLSLGAHRYEAIDGSLRTLDYRTAIPAAESEPFNPGITRARYEPMGKEATMTQTRVYTAAQHRFFDDLINMLVCSVAFGSTMQAFRGDELDFDDGKPTLTKGSPKVLGFNLTLDSKLLLEPLEHGRRPDRLEFAEESMSEAQRLVWEPLPQPGAVLAPVFHASFVHYYESLSDEIEAAYGKQPKNFPDIVRFGWAVRNAFAHNGLIWIKDPTISVSWKGLTYSQADNGRQILYTDLMPAELIVLMDELDLAIPR